MLLLCFGLRLRAERGLALIERLCKSGVKAAHYDPCILSRRLKLNIHQIKWQFSIQIYKYIYIYRIFGLPKLVVLVLDYVSETII